MTKQLRASASRSKTLLTVETLEERRLMSAPATLQLGLQAPQVVVGDFNGDGRTDVARLSTAGIWRVGLSEVSSFHAQIWGRWGNRDRWLSIQVGDFNGDGKDDIAALSRAGTWQLGLSQGDHFTSQVWEFGFRTTSWVSIKVGDFDRDGKDDVATFTRDGTWYVGLSTGSSFRTTVWGNWNSSARWASFVVGDFNGDHRDDIAGFTRAGTWTVGLSTGTMFTLRNGPTWNNSSRWTNLFVGDFDGNGTDDVVGITKLGASVVSTSLAGNLTTTKVWANWQQAGHWLDWQVGDFNRDGKDELAGVNDAGIISVGNSFGSYFHPSPQDRWRGAVRFANIVAGDFTGDGTTDLAGFYRTDGLWLVARSTGNDLKTKSFGDWPLGLDQGSYLGERLPFTSDAPWDYSNARGFVSLQSFNQLRRMFFNSPRTYETFVENYKDVVRSWIAEADAAGIRTEAQLETFLSKRLDEHFIAVRPLLAAQYPGLTDVDYRLFMAMNLAHAHLIYATAYSNGKSIWRTLRQTFGDCSEIADVCAALARLQGLNARVLGASMNFTSSVGPLVAGHQLVYVPGKWLLDAEINVAFRVDLNHLATITPAYRLQSLFDSRSIFGFYNWYLKPDVRQEQLSRGLDGGIIAFYYQYYLEAIGNDKSVFYFMRR